MEDLIRRSGQRELEAILNLKQKGYFNMSTYRFEWFTKEKGNHLMIATSSHPIDAILSALEKCGFDNRTTLKLMDDTGRRTILNWWEMSPHLPFCHPKNWKSDYEFHKRKSFWKGYM